MAATLEEINAARDLIEELYRRLEISEVSNHYTYMRVLDERRSFGLDESTYRGPYMGLLNEIYSIEAIRQSWSEDALYRRLDDLLGDLAHTKVEAGSTPDFSSIATTWLSSFDVRFEEKECFVPVRGLSVEKPLKVKATTFIPLEEARARLKGHGLTDIFEGLHPIRDCIASSRIAAEDQKATEILRAQAEGSLNLLRYFGSLVWHNQPRRHIYIAGREPKGISYAVTIPPSGSASRIGRSEFTPLPFTVDDEFLAYAESYDFSFVLSLYSDQSPQPIASSLLLAIQWYGDALQDLTEIFAFTKYYVAIEAALKRGSERAKEVIPRRLSVLIEPHIKAKQMLIEKDIAGLVDERNAIFHSGKPAHKTIGYLAWFSHVMAMQCLHHLRIRIKQEGLKTKDDLDTWVSSMYDKYLV